MLNVLHVGLGPLGRTIAGDLHRRGLGRVTAAVDPAPELAGARLVDIVPQSARAGGSDVTIAPSLDELAPDARFDAAIVTTVSDLARCAPTLRSLLERGAAVVSTCEELSYPRLRHPELSDELDALARSTGARLLGTGINPGFLMDTLPSVASAVCTSVGSVRVERVQDASTRRLPFQAKIGAALDLATFDARVADGSLRHVGLGESLHFLAEALGIDLGHWEETIDPVIAEAPLECGLGPIASGHARGVRQIARGFAGDRVAIELVFHAAIGEQDPRDRVVIEGQPGEPGIELVIPGGVHGDAGTSAVTLNSIPSLIASAPGLHTMLTIPTVHFAPPAGTEAPGSSRVA